MWVSMIGTITQTVDEKHFEYGVKRYPELDNALIHGAGVSLNILRVTTSAVTSGQRLLTSTWPEASATPAFAREADCAPPASCGIDITTAIPSISWIGMHAT